MYFLLFIKKIQAFLLLNRYEYVRVLMRLCKCAHLCALSVEQRNVNDDVESKLIIKIIYGQTESYIRVMASTATEETRILVCKIQLQVETVNLALLFSFRSSKG